MTCRAMFLTFRFVVIQDQRPVPSASHALRDADCTGSMSGRHLISERQISAVFNIIFGTSITVNEEPP